MCVVSFLPDNGKEAIVNCNYHITYYSQNTALGTLARLLIVQFLSLKVMSNDALSSDMSVYLRQTTTPESTPLLLTNKDTSGQNLSDSSEKLPGFQDAGIIS